MERIIPAGGDEIHNSSVVLEARVRPGTSSSSCVRSTCDRALLAYAFSMTSIRDLRGERYEGCTLCDMGLEEDPTGDFLVGVDCNAKLV